MSTRCATSVPSAGETPTGLDQVVLLQPLDGRGCSTRSGCHPATASRSWILAFRQDPAGRRVNPWSSGVVQRRAASRVPTRALHSGGMAACLPAQTCAITPACASDLRNSGQIVLLHAVLQRRAIAINYLVILPANGKNRRVWTASARTLPDRLNGRFTRGRRTCQRIRSDHDDHAAGNSATG